MACCMYICQQLQSATSTSQGLPHTHHRPNVCMYSLSAKGLAIGLSFIWLYLGTQTHRCRHCVSSILKDFDILYGWKFWRGIYFGELAVVRAIRQTFYSMPLYVMLSICHPLSFKSFKLPKNGTKIVQIWSTISWFQRRSMYYGSKWTQQCLHYYRSGLLHMSPSCYEYNYGIRLTQPPN